MINFSLAPAGLFFINKSTMSQDLKYDARGVSANKSEVHAAIKNLDKGLYPNAFCKILPDHVTGDEDYCNIMHADTAGTKTSLAYVYWKETGDVNVWKGILQDSIVMNLDDLGAVGAFNNIVLSSTIGRNKSIITGDVISAIINGTKEFCDKLAEYGITIPLAGGETADVGDIVRTIDVGYTAFVRMKKEDLIINDIKPGNVIVGLASYGQATYEDEYNSGIGSNGLTSGRHDVMSKYVGETYPDSYNPLIPEEVVYTGPHKPKDIDDETGLPIGKLLLSPTRTFLPVLKPIIEKYKSDISGIIHATGGAHTKVLHFCDNVNIIKDNMLPVPPIFRIIQKASGTDWKEMFQVFNMGTRFEFYVNESVAQGIIDIAKEFNIDAQIIGKVEAADDATVTLNSDYGNFVYNK